MIPIPSLFLPCTLQILHQDELTEDIAAGQTAAEVHLTLAEALQSYILHPNHPFRRTFDGFTVLFVFYLLYKIPFDVAFDWYVNTKEEKGFLIFLDVWFFLDIILNFKTGFIHNGTVVMHPKKVIYHYLTGWFLIDLLGTIPFKYMIDPDQATSGKSIKLTKFFKIPKLLRISRILKYLRDNRQVYDIFKIFVFVVVSIHMGACLWILAIDPCPTNYDISERIWCGHDKTTLRAFTIGQEGAAGPLSRFVNALLLMPSCL